MLALGSEPVQDELLHDKFYGPRQHMVFENIGKPVLDHSSFERHRPACSATPSVQDSCCGKESFPNHRVSFMACVILQLRWRGLPTELVFKEVAHLPRKRAFLKLAVMAARSFQRWAAAADVKVPGITDQRHTVRLSEFLLGELLRLHAALPPASVAGSPVRTLFFTSVQEGF